MDGFWSVMLGLAGVFSLGAGLREVRILARLRRLGVRGVGVVVRLDSKASDMGSRLYRPVVAFTDEHGVQREVRGRVGSTRRPPAVGTRISVVYPPNRPEAARLDTRTERLNGVGIGIGVGLVFIAGAVLLAAR
jgi:Protein of unknown function (DUF3592)